MMDENTCAAAAPAGKGLPSPAEIDEMLVLPPGHEGRRREMAEAVVAALGIVRDFAARHGWSGHVRAPFFHRVEIHADRETLWRRILDLNGVEDAPMPTDALTGALEEGVLLAILPEEAERARPEYFASPQDWVQALAHEIVHRLHVRILGGDEDAMGPQWFYEGFAVIGSGQPLGSDLRVDTVDQALALTRAEQRGAYACYAAALRFFAARIPLPELVARAGQPDFEAWLAAAANAP